MKDKNGNSITVGTWCKLENDDTPFKIIDILCDYDICWYYCKYNDCSTKVIYAFDDHASSFIKFSDAEITYYLLRR